VLHLALVFFVLALIAGVVGLTGIASAFGSLAYYAAAGFILLAVLSFLFNRPAGPVDRY
jgi:uncharacterized membrane protein YtjA (UPF0391 family)